MNKNYKFLFKKLICNKVRNIYIKINSKSKKQYLKYKCKMININKYKKIKTYLKNNNKKIYRKKKRGYTATYDLLNNNKKIYRKKKGGYNKKFNLLIEDKLKIFIDKIKSLSKDQIVEIQNEFLNIYKNIRDRHSNECASINEHLDFLTTLLIYFDYNYHKLGNKNYNSNLEKIMQLLQTIEEDGITGIYSYDSNPNPNPNPYVMKLRTNFDIINNVIENFINKHKKVIWNIFIVKTKLTVSNITVSNISISNITISNTQVKEFIRYMISYKGLSDYKERRSKPYERFNLYKK